VSEADEESVLIFMTSGPQTPQRCATPFYMATMAAVMDAEVDLVLQIDGVLLVKKGVAEGMMAKEGGKPIIDFIREATEAGVRIHVCSAALGLHDMTVDDLIEECHGVVGAAFMVERGMEAAMVLNY